MQQIPVENQEVISLTWNMLQELDDEEFNSIIEGLTGRVIRNTIRRMRRETREELRREGSEDVFGGYEDSPEEEDGDTLTPPEDEGETPEVTIDDILPSDDEPNYESMSKRELEREIDTKLDGDMDLVRMLGSILNKK